MFKHNQNESNMMSKRTWVSLIAASSLAAVLIGCGGGGGSDLIGGSGGGSGGGGGAFTEEGTARVDVDVQTGAVTVTPLNHPGFGQNQSRSLFTGSAVSISSTQLFTDPGELTLRKLNLTVKNNTTDPIGTTGGTRLIIDKIGETDTLDLRPFTNVETIVGPGSTSGDGPGPSVTITQPTGVDRDTDGTLYLTGSGDGTLRKLKDGNVTRLATGLTSPGGVGVSGASAFVMEQTGHQLVRVPTSGGSKFVMAGNGSPGLVDGAGAVARFNTPRDIEIFGSTAYITDTNNDRIRTATNLAGGSATVGTLNVFPVIVSPSGIASMNLGGIDWLVVTSTVAHKVYLVNSANGQSFVLAGTGGTGSADGSGFAATFNTPFDVAVSNGAIFVTDLGTRLIRQITLNSGAQPQFSSSWTVKTIAGTGVSGAVDGTGDIAQFASPRFMETDGSGGIVFSDLSNNRFRKLNAVSGVFPVTGTGGSGGQVEIRTQDGFVPPSDTGTPKPYFDMAALEAKGSISDNDSVEITFEVTGNVRAFSFVVSLTASSEWLNTLDAVTTVGAPRRGSPNVNVRTVAGSGGPGYQDGSSINAKFESNGRICEAGNGIYVADTGNNTIRRFDKITGTTVTLFGLFGDNTVAAGTGTMARVGAVNGIWVNEEETEGYVTSFGNHYVGRFYRFNPSMSVPSDQSSWNFAPIVGLPGTSGQVANVTGDLARLSAPRGIVADPTGNTVYVVEQDNHRVLRLTHTGGDKNTSTNWFSGVLAGSSTGASGDVDGTGTAARFTQPTGLAQTEQGTLVVCENVNRVRLVSTSGVVTLLAGPSSFSDGYVDAVGSSARFSLPTDVAVGDGGMVYVADQGSNRAIRRIRLSTGEVMTTAANSALSGINDGPGNLASFNVPNSAAFDSRRGLYILDGGRLRLLERIVRNGAP